MLGTNRLLVHAVTALVLIGLLLGTPTPMDTGLWGIRLGASPSAVRSAYAPTGAPTSLKWTEERSGEVLRVEVRCQAEALCFAVPAEADFVFIAHRLVSVSLRADAERAPPRHPVREALLSLSASSGLTVADATARVVGRFTRYFLRPGYTVAWVQDGPDVEIKLYLDAVSPLGRAEAAAAGARTDLSGLPGAEGYAKAHGAIAKADFGAAIDALDALLAEKGVGRLMRDEASVVLAMALAARAQRWGKATQSAPPDWKKRAEADLSRAEKLAPVLSEEIRALRGRLLGPSAGP